MADQIQTLKQQIRVQEFDICCSKQADNAYYVSGRFDFDQKVLRRLKKELAFLKQGQYADKT